MLHRTRSLLSIVYLIGALAFASACQSNTTLQTIAVTAPSATLAKGTTLQLTALGTYSDGTTGDISSLVRWTSSNASVLTVAQGGIASGASVGQSSAVASYKGISGALNLTTSAATLMGVSVQPPVAAIAVGTTQAFTAMGTFSDGTSQDLTSMATWTITTALVAKLTGATAMGAAAGQTSIKAAALGQSGSATLVVSSATVTSLTVSPSTITLANGTTGQLSVIGTFSDGTTQDVTSQVTWSSAASAIAAVTTPYGQLTAKGTGSAVITAALGSQSASSMCTVSAATAVSIAVTPAAPVLALGTSTTLAATATFSDGTTQDVTAMATWASSQTLVGTVMAGAVTTATKGTAQISATFMNVSGAATLNVTDATVTTLVIKASPNLTAPAGTSLQLTCAGIFSDTTVQDLTSLVNWYTEGSQVATIGNLSGQRGVLSALKQGSAPIGATYRGVNAFANFIVTAPVLSAISVSSMTPAITPGQSAQYMATGVFSDGSTMDITSTVTWLISDASIASSSSTGSFSGTKPGTVTITASSGSISGSATLSVTTAPVTLASIAITPNPAFVGPGASVGFTATGTYSDGSTQDLSSQVTWSSTGPAVASISNATGTHGLASAVASQGSTTIGASLGAMSAPAVTLTVAKRLFMTGQGNGNLGGVSGADTTCQSNRPAGMAGAKAVISDGVNRIACTTANCGGGAAEHTDWTLSANTQYITLTGTVIGITNGVGLFTFPLSNTIPGAPAWFSGMNTNWTSMPMGSNCMGWTSSAAVGDGLGLTFRTDTSFLYGGNSRCDVVVAGVLCAEQ